MEAWEVRNAEWIEKLHLKSRDRILPNTDVILALDPGRVYEPRELPEIALAPGVSATVAWGQGALLELLEMKPHATYPEQTLTGELITVVQQGTATCMLGDGTLELDPDAVVYLTEGMKRSLRAGPSGLKAMEVFSPVRVDHLNLAGVAHPEDASVGFPDQGVEQPSLAPGRKHRLRDVPRIPIVLPGQSESEPPPASTQLIWGRNVMLSFVRMEPKALFPMHIHPEDQLMMILDGAMKEGVIDAWLPMNGAQRHVILQPGGMVHGAKLSDQGADVLDVFWPVRPDYIALYEKFA